MTTTHPLIDTLMREVDDSKKLTGRLRTGFRSAVRKFSQSDTELGRQGLEKIYVIIYAWRHMYDSSRPADSPPESLPYSGQMTDKGPEFDYELLPDMLRRVLCLFASKHMELMTSAETGS